MQGAVWLAWLAWPGKEGPDKAGVAVPGEAWSGSPRQARRGKTGPVTPQQSPRTMAASKTDQTRAKRDQKSGGRAGT